LAFHGIINAQVPVSPDDIVGTWTFHGSNKISLNDTITLSKKQPDAKRFSQWTFKAQDNVLEMYNRFMQDDEESGAIDVKSQGVKWSVKVPDLLIIHRTSNDLYFKAFENTNDKIVLVRIK